MIGVIKMLPDLPDFKKTLHGALMRYVSKRAHGQLGIFSDVPRHIIQEGASTRISRANGEVEDSELIHSSAESLISREEAKQLSHANRMKILNGIADQLAGDMATKLYSVLEESLERAGQVVDGKGKPFDTETFFSALEIMQMDFERDGSPKFPTFSMPPEKRPALVQALQKIETDPGLRQRMENLLGAKKADWRDREAARKLVG